MSAPKEAYPLNWPAGWRRTESWRRTNALFRDGNGASAGRIHVGQGTNRILRELRAFGVSQDTVVISSHLRLRTDGLPYATQATANLDPGVAVYWTDGKRQRCIAVDRYSRLADNMAAIAATLDAMRAIERHGGAEILDRAFTGFIALPAPEQWFQVLGVGANASREEIDTAFRRKAMESHPDRGGDDVDMARLNQARADGLEART